MRKILLSSSLLFFSYIIYGQCPDLVGAMVNSCGTSEGNNEFLIFTTSVTANASTYAVKYGIPNPPTTNTLSGSDAGPVTGIGSVTGGGGCTVVSITNPATSIPAGSKVIFIPTTLDQLYDVTGLCGGGTIYVVYIKMNAAAGGASSNFTPGGTMANAPAAPNLSRFLQVTYSGNAACANATAPVKSYTNGWSSNIDGNFVSWSGTTPSYINNGCTAIVLPVVLTDFSVSNTNNSNVFIWKTATEANTKQFELQKSFDAVNYTTVATVPSANNSATEKSYSYTIASTETNTVYYRLKMVDNDGRSTYSNVLKLYPGKKGFAINTIYPMPALDKLNVEWNAVKNTNTSIITTDITGRIINTLPVKSKIGFNKLVIDVANIQRGTYVIKMICDNEAVMQKFIKQ
jgi:Secretion system C-terminal sorting domain